MLNLIFREFLFPHSDGQISRISLAKKSVEIIIERERIRQEPEVQYQPRVHDNYQQQNASKPQPTPFSAGFQGAIGAGFGCLAFIFIIFVFFFRLESEAAPEAA